MSRTTTAAASVRRNQPPASFDWVVAHLPPELSPTNRCLYTDTSFCLDEELGTDPAAVQLPILPSNSLLPFYGTAATPRLIVNSRNTFVHLESSSPLAQVSNSDLLRSFRAFSDKLSRQATPPHLATVDENAGHNFDLSAWIAEDPSRYSVGNLCSWIKNPARAEYVNIFASGVAAPLLNPLPDDDDENNSSKQQLAKVTDDSTTDNPNDKDELAKDQIPPKGYRDGHPVQCKPCAFFWSKGCLNGDACLFCHLWHVPKRKKPMKEQKNLMIIAKEDGKIAFLRCHVEEALTA